MVVTKKEKSQIILLIFKKQFALTSKNQYNIRVSETKSEKENVMNAQNTFEYVPDEPEEEKKDDIIVIDEASEVSKDQWGSKGETEPAAPETGTELITFTQADALKAFTTEKGLDPVLKDIKDRVESEVFDVTSQKGRDRIGSVGRQIGSMKKRMEESALDLTEGWRSKTATVNKEKKRMVEEMDSLRDAVLAPRVEFDKREEERVFAHKTKLAVLQDGNLFEFPDPDVKQINERIKLIEDISDRNWDEFGDSANAAYINTKDRLNVMHSARVKRDEEQAELERLREAEEARKQKERDDTLKAEAAEKATKEAEDKAEKEAAEAKAKTDKAAADAKAEQDRLQKEKDDAETKAIEDAEKAEADRKAAAEQAELEKTQAVEAERKRQKDEADKAEAETARLKKIEDDRAQNQNHKDRIENEVLSAIKELLAVTDPDHVAKNLTLAISGGSIPHVKIEY